MEADVGETALTRNLPCGAQHGLRQKGGGQHRRLLDAVIGKPPEGGYVDAARPQLRAPLRQADGATAQHGMTAA